ncbi:MAG TPA: peptidylprolyl isomerase [Mycobacteriales bacterium]|nr:peptidylprolyl isomerase [Mycobacteriales bacterium]
MTAAWVDGEPVAAAEVDAEVARLRAGPLADRLPPADGPDGRQLRRWVAQRVVIRRLLERAAAELPFRDGAAGAPVRDGAAGPAVGDGAARPDAALVGSAAADVLATSAAARAVLATFTDRPDEGELRAHYDAHPDRYVRPERWLVRQAFHRDDPGRLELSGPVEVDPGTLVAELRDAPAGPVRSLLGWHRIVVESVRPAGPVPYEEVRAAIAAELTVRRQQLAFARWLDAALATRVRLAPGYEHPADPRQPDATHRH